MNERNLSRMLSMSVIDALKAQGHILVVKGGATVVIDAVVQTGYSPSMTAGLTRAD